MTAYRVAFRKDAARQLRSLQAWIESESSAKTAADYVNSIIEECQSLASHPHRGRRRDDIRPGMRILGFRRRVVIAFSIENEIVAILGVFYGGQDYESTLR